MGAIVRIVDTYTGALTDEAGEFSLTFREGTQIEFQYTGLETCVAEIDHTSLHIDAQLPRDRFWKKKQEPCVVTWKPAM